LELEPLLLKDPEVFPTEGVLKEVLAESWPAYDELLKEVQLPGYGLTPYWNYYKDGKAWLCKVSFKKKTVFWLSVREKYFSTTFYFTDKNNAAISGLDIGKAIKDDFFSGKYFGKLRALTITFREKEQIKDFLAIVSYKMTLK